MRARGLGSVGLGRTNNTAPKLALMGEVVGHGIVERVVVLPDNHGIRSPSEAKMEFRPLGVAIQFTEQLVSFRGGKLDGFTWYVSAGLPRTFV